MSGNSKQRRQFRRRLAREGMTYVPPSDYRRRFIDPDVYLELPPVVSSYEYPNPWLYAESLRSLAKDTDFGSRFGRYGSELRRPSVRDFIAGMDFSKDENDNEDTPT